MKSLNSIRKSLKEITIQADQMAHGNFHLKTPNGKNQYRTELIQKEVLKIESQLPVLEENQIFLRAIILDPEIDKKIDGLILKIGPNFKVSEALKELDEKEKIQFKELFLLNSRIESILQKLSMGGIEIDDRAQINLIDESRSFKQVFKRIDLYKNGETVLFFYFKEIQFQG